VRSISSRVMTVSGNAPSPSTRRILDPVTSTRMSCASAGKAPPDTASATAAASGRRARNCMAFIRYSPGRTMDVVVERTIACPIAIRQA
jgi:hypothetical protein